MVNNWYNIPQQTKVNAYTQIAETTGMAPFAVEKDWWVVQVLSALFELDIGSSLIFKGGTSLSKAWGLIERFSEDVDLVFDRSFFGYDGKINRTQVRKLRKDAGKYFETTLAPKLENRLIYKGLSGIKQRYIKQKASDADPIKIEINYPNVMEYPGAMEPRVLLEISCSSLVEPSKTRSINSLLDEQYPDADFSQKHIDIPVVVPERTFLEKLFLLHEEFHRPKDRVRTKRQSRHLYDIFQLLKSEYGLMAIDNRELYATIVKHRYTFNRVGGVDYNLHQPSFLNPVPPQEFVKPLKDDYTTMQEEMIYGDSPGFDQIMGTISAVTEYIINLLDWRIDIEFPKP